MRRLPLLSFPVLDDHYNQAATALAQSLGDLRTREVRSDAQAREPECRRCGALLLLGASDLRLSLPLVVWFVGYAVLLRILVPRLRERSRAGSEARSTLTGRIVDTSTNILTVKLFARPPDDAAFARAPVDARPEGAPVLVPAQPDAPGGLARRKRAVDVVIRAVSVFLDIQNAGRLAVHLAGAVAVHLLVAPVAAHDMTVLDEDDADRGAAQDRLLFAQQAVDLVAVTLALGDVLRNPG